MCVLGTCSAANATARHGWCRCRQSVHLTKQSLGRLVVGGCWLWLPSPLQPNKYRDLGITALQLLTLSKVLPYFHTCTAVLQYYQNTTSILLIRYSTNLCSLALQSPLMRASSVDGDRRCLLRSCPHQRYLCPTAGPGQYWRTWHQGPPQVLTSRL
jgi:hypothetical protein